MAGSDIFGTGVEKDSDEEQKDHPAEDVEMLISQQTKKRRQPPQTLEELVEGNAPILKRPHPSIIASIES